MNFFKGFLIIMTLKQTTSGLLLITSYRKLESKQTIKEHKNLRVLTDCTMFLLVAPSDEQI